MERYGTEDNSIKPCPKNIFHHHKSEREQTDYDMNYEFTTRIKHFT